MAPSERKRGGRTVGSQSGRTKENLLEAASRLMCRRPDADVTISEIAAEAGANSALISYYFGNKDGLLMALLQRNTHGGLDDFRSIISSPLPTVEKIRLHISGLVNLYYKYPYHNRLLSYLIEHADEEHRATISEDVIKPLIELYRILLESGERSGELRPIDPMFFYFSLIGACERLFTGRYSMQMAFGIVQVDVALKRRFVEHTVDLIVPGMLSNAQYSSAPATLTVPAPPAQASAGDHALAGQAPLT